MQADDALDDLDDDITAEPLHEIVMVRRVPVAFSTDLIEEILPMPRAAPMPLQPPTMRGMVWVRSDLIPAFDLRALLSMPSSVQEFDELAAQLATRRKEHEDWLHALEASVRDGVPFTLARDAAQCAFGRWYGGFRGEDFSLTSVSAQSLLRAFDRPHRAIHALADEVLALAASDREAATARIREARETTLAELLHLFDECERDLSAMRRELCLVVRVNGRRVGLAVDAVRAIDPLTEISASHESQTDTKRLSTLVGRWKPRNDNATHFVEIIDPARLAAAVGV